MTQASFLTWRDQIETRWVNWKDVIEALDRVLSAGEFPGLEQAKPVEFGLSPTVRFTIQLRINTLEHHQPPQIFVLVTPEEAVKIGRIGEGMELMLKRRIAQTSFKADKGYVVDTSIQKDGDGTWRALTVDGLRWKFDKSQDLWTKERALAA